MGTYSQMNNYTCPNWYLADSKIILEIWTLAVAGYTSRNYAFRWIQDFGITPAIPRVALSSKGCVIVLKFWCYMSQQSLSHCPELATTATSDWYSDSYDDLECCYWCGIGTIDKIITKLVSLLLDITWRKGPFRFEVIVCWCHRAKSYHSDLCNGSQGLRVGCLHSAVRDESARACPPFSIRQIASIHHYLRTSWGTYFIRRSMWLPGTDRCTSKSMQKETIDILQSKCFVSMPRKTSGDVEKWGEHRHRRRSWS